MAEYDILLEEAIRKTDKHCYGCRNSGTCVIKRNLHDLLSNNKDILKNHVENLFGAVAAYCIGFDKK